MRKGGGEVVGWICVPMKEAVGSSTLHMYGNLDPRPIILQPHNFFQSNYTSASTTIIVIITTTTTKYHSCFLSFNLNYEYHFIHNNSLYHFIELLSYIQFMYRSQWSFARPMLSR